MAARPFSLASPAHTRPCLCVSNALSALHPQAAPSNHRNKSLACGNKMWLIFLSKVKIGNQEVEIALFTPLDYNLVRGCNKHLFNNEHCRITSAYSFSDEYAGSFAEVHCPIMCAVLLFMKFPHKKPNTEPILCACRAGSGVWAGQTGSGPTETQLCWVSCVWLRCDWQQGSLSLTDRQER